MNFNIDRDDNIFFDLKKWYDVELLLLIIYEIIPFVARAFKAFLIIFFFIFLIRFPLISFKFLACFAFIASNHSFESCEEFDNVDELFPSI